MTDRGVVRKCYTYLFSAACLRFVYRLFLPNHHNYYFRALRKMYNKENGWMLPCAIRFVRFLCQRFIVLQSKVMRMGEDDW